MIDMTPIEFLEYKLSDDELDVFLAQIMNYSCYRSIEPHFHTDLRIMDEEGDYVDYKQIIGNKDICIVKNVLLLKEKVDEDRGSWRGKYEVQRQIKNALNIN